MPSFVRGTQPGWRPSMTGLLMACSFSGVCSPSWCSVWVLVSEARTTHLQLLKSGLPNSRIPRPVRFFCVPVVFINCASYTDYRPIFLKIVLWQAQHHSYAVGHFKHCSSYAFFFFCLRQLSSSLTKVQSVSEMFLSVRQDVHARMSGDAVRIFPMCRDGRPLQVGTPPLLITGLWPHTASRPCCQRPQTVSSTGYFNNIILDLVRSTFMAQRPRTTFSSPSLTTVSLSRFQA